VAARVAGPRMWLAAAWALLAAASGTAFGMCHFRKCHEERDNVSAAGQARRLTVEWTAGL
jgi:hypothetical protein